MTEPRELTLGESELRRLITLRKRALEQLRTILVFYEAAHQAALQFVRDAETRGEIGIPEPPYLIGLLGNVDNWLGLLRDLITEWEATIATMEFSLEQALKDQRRRSHLELLPTTETTNQDFSDDTNEHDERS